MERTDNFEKGSGKREDGSCAEGIPMGEDGRPETDEWIVAVCSEQ